MELYANYDSYANSYQPIVAGTATQVNNCHAANRDGPCYYSYGIAYGSGVQGEFDLMQVSDTFMQVAFSPSGNLNYGPAYYELTFDINFDGFGYDSSCSISSLVAEISATNVPGSGVNNTIAPDTITA